MVDGPHRPHRFVEESLRHKVLIRDFRYPLRDTRLSIARMCALQGRYEKAAQWFAKAREVLDEAGWRPLRAIVDYDESLTYLRRGTAGDESQAQRLLDAALQQFRTLGMPGWIRRAEIVARASSRNRGASFDRVAAISASLRCAIRE